MSTSRFQGVAQLVVVPREKGINARVTRTKLQIERDLLEPYFTRQAKDSRNRYSTYVITTRILPCDNCD